MEAYEDIIHLPHHVSSRHSPMSMIDRGAQFSPFAALTGYEAVIEESARETEAGIELAEGALEALDQILRQLCDRIDSRPWASFTCFQPDERKTGGAYVKISGRLKKFDSLRRCLVLEDERRIPIESIISIET